MRYRFVDCAYALDRVEAGREAYLQAHVPGASFFGIDELSDLSAQGQGRHPLPSADAFAAAASRAGIPFRFHPTYRRLARVFGVTPERAWVDLTDDELEARYGPWRVRTRIDNVARVEATGPYAFLKTAGPARLAITDRGLTFASNGDRGVCLTFRSPVAGIDRRGLIRHPELTVTVLDVDGLVEALARHDIERRR